MGLPEPSAVIRRPGKCSPLAPLITPLPEAECQSVRGMSVEIRVLQPRSLNVFIVQR